MSSNTRYYVVPAPTVYRTKVDEVVSIDTVLGPGGAQYLKETLVEVTNPRSMLRGGFADLSKWEPVKGRQDCYQTQVEGTPVVLRLGGSVARVMYAHDISTYGEPQPLEAAHHQVVSQRINQLLAVALARRVSVQLRQLTGPRVRMREEVKLTADNRTMLRVTGYSRVQ